VVPGQRQDDAQGGSGSEFVVNDEDVQMLCGWSV
jgi:hypothetical protein